MINLVFSLFQFFCFCVCCGYLVRKYLPLLKQSYAEERTRRELLQTHNDELKKKLQSITSDSHHQILSCNSLLTNVQRWKERVDITIQKEEEARTFYREQVRTKYIQQRKARELQLAQHDLLTAIIADVRTKVEQTFTNQSTLCSEQARSYNDRCLKRLSNDQGLS